jgi:hypothetical protein
MAIERLIEEHEADIAHQRSSKGGRLRLRQPAALTVDWRVLPLQLCGNQHVVGSPTVHGHHPHSHHGHGQGGTAMLPPDTLLSDPFLARACRVTAQLAPKHWATPAQLAFAAGATVTLSYDRAAALAVAALSHSSHTASAHGGGAKEAHALAQSLALDVRPAAPPAVTASSSSASSSSASSTSSNSTGVPAAVYGGPGSGVSETHRRTLLFHLRGLVRRLKLSVPGGMCLHATALLLRYVRRLWLTLVGDGDTCALACIRHTS